MVRLLDDKSHREIKIEKALELLNRAKLSGDTHLIVAYAPAGHDQAVTIETTKKE